MRRALILSLSALLLLPATAGAITLHQHTIIDRPLGPPLEVVHVVTVAPGDSDDDGCRNSRDDFQGSGCKAPPAPPAAQSSSVSVASAPATTSVTSTSGGCPSYMAGEASSPDAVNPSSGAAGCYQVTPGTQAAYPECADVNSTSCVAAICATQGNAAWAASGSTPCDYIRP